MYTIQKIIAVLFVTVLLVTIVLLNSPEYEIRVDIQPAGAGEITGTGVYREGDTARLEARPKEEYVFEGWYQNGENVAEDKVYRWEASEDTKLTARFKQTVRIPDPVLEEAIRKEIGEPSGRLTLKDMKQLTELEIIRTELEDLSGLEYATELKSLSLRYNRIEDIKSIGQLKELRKLFLMITL